MEETKETTPTYPTKFFVEIGGEKVNVASLFPYSGLLKTIVEDGEFTMPFGTKEDLERLMDFCTKYTAEPYPDIELPLVVKPGATQEERFKYREKILGKWCTEWMGEDTKERHIANKQVMNMANYLEILLILKAIGTNISILRICGKHSKTIRKGFNLKFGFTKKQWEEEKNRNNWCLKPIRGPEPDEDEFEPEPSEEAASAGAASSTPPAAVSSSS